MRNRNLGRNMGRKQGYHFWQWTYRGEEFLREIAFECPAWEGGDEKCVLPPAAEIR